jgi:hypothetical protein
MRRFLRGRGARGSRHPDIQTSRQENAPGFVPKGEVRQPGADASPHWVMRQRIQSQAEGPGSIPIAVFHSGPQRKTPAPKGARVCRRMGEGLGAGGHSTRRYAFNARASPRFLSSKLFSSLASPRKAPATRARPVCQIGGQFDVAAIGKLEISQTDAKASLSPAAALDHVARADREPAGETVCNRTHKYLLEPTTLLGTFRPPMPDHHDGSETARQQPQISVNRCGQGARHAVRSGLRGGCPEFRGRSGLADS